MQVFNLLFLIASPECSQLVYSFLWPPVCCYCQNSFRSSECSEVLAVTLQNFNSFSKWVRNTCTWTSKKVASSLKKNQKTPSKTEQKGLNNWNIGWHGETGLWPPCSELGGGVDYAELQCEELKLAFLSAEVFDDTQTQLPKRVAWSTYFSLEIYNQVFRLKLDILGNLSLVFIQKHK